MNEPTTLSLVKLIDYVVDNLIYYCESKCLCEMLKISLALYGKLIWNKSKTIWTSIARDENLPADVVWVHASLEERREEKSAAASTVTHINHLIDALCAASCRRARIICWHLVMLVSERSSRFFASHSGSQLDKKEKVSWSLLYTSFLVSPFV